MKSFLITYKTQSGKTLTEVVKCKSEKLTKQIHNYYFNSKCEILSVNLINQ